MTFQQAGRGKRLRRASGERIVVWTQKEDPQSRIYIWFARDVLLAAHLYAGERVAVLIDTDSRPPVFYIRKPQVDEVSYKLSAQRRDVLKRVKENGTSPHYADDCTLGFTAREGVWPLVFTNGSRRLVVCELVTGIDDGIMFQIPEED